MAKINPFLGYFASECVCLCVRDGAELCAGRIIVLVEDVFWIRNTLFPVGKEEEG